MSYTYWTPVKRKRIADLAAKGLTASEIAKLTRIQSQVIRYLARAYNINVAPGSFGHPVEPRGIVRAVELISAGRTLKEIRRETGFCRTHIRNIAERHRLKIKPDKGGQPRIIDWEKVREAAKSLTCIEVSRLLKIDHSTAIYISRKMGFSFQPYKRPKQERCTSRRATKMRQLPIEEPSNPERVARLMKLAAIIGRRA